MSHEESRNFLLSVKNKFPEKFSNSRVLDIGSLDINGNNKYLFDNCSYVGLDVAEGKNVDIVSLAHEYNEPNESFDIIVSSDCFEHDMYWKMTFSNITRMLKPKGLFFFSCKTTGAGEHGTLRTDGGFSSPLTSKIQGWENYYRNITEEDVRSAIDVDNVFCEYFFETLKKPADLRFYGIKK